ncbi:MAG: hypothetical protein ACE5JF_04310 [Anaerolineales bacterium]
MSPKEDFYIGRHYELDSGKTQQDQTLYDPDDLTTHGVVVGMTGSGKTGLCVDILEEAALAGIPALLVDPKGDITNLLLHFPNLEPADFAPWIDPDEARRQDVTVESLAEATSQLWRNGLNKWDIEPDRIRQVSKSVQYAIYSPGSSSGIPISILASLAAPEVEWSENQEVLREKISSTVTAILGLLGVDADPLQSKEHILLSNIFEAGWSTGKDLDLVGLIEQTQDPPFSKLGAFDLDEFYPKGERAELATALNSLIASPSFQVWTQGQPLDVHSLLWTPDGRQRHSVLYLAHLSDEERMFFVTLLLTAVEAYIRTQPGSSSLKAMLYFDELFGYMPPVANPPSKEPLLRLLKQARAFGLGLLLVTQNPVDLDYKGLGNAGTWFIGRLQAERDKGRLLDGLEGAREGLNRGELDRTVSAIDKRVFLLHNVHTEGHEIFKTRWAMAYLRGPITRARLSELNQLVGADEPTADLEALPPIETATAGTRPSIPSSVEEYFLPNNQTVSEAIKQVGSEDYSTAGLIYRPALLAQATARFLDRKLDLDHEIIISSLVADTDRVRWKDHLNEPISADKLDREPASEAGFMELTDSVKDAKVIKQLEGDFADFVYHQAELKLFWNQELKLVAQPGTTKEVFEEQAARAAQEMRDEEAKQLRRKYEKKIDALKAKLTREERELAEDQAEHSARKMEEMATHAENVLGVLGLGSRRRVSSSLTKRRLSAKAKADVEESVQAIADFQSQLEQLEDEMAEELDELDDRWIEAASEVDELVKTPKKKDIYIDLFGVAWFPHWQVEQAGELRELPGFKF